MSPPPSRATRDWRTARWARRVVQVVFFVLFVYLLLTELQRHDPHPYASIFFRFDPLAAFGTMLAARTWLPHMAVALVTVALTVLLGRVWCGWICPLGTLLGWLRFRGAEGAARHSGRAAKRLPPRLRVVKYLLLIVIAVMAALGSLTLMVLDPISLLTRTATVSLLPPLSLAVTELERLALRWPALEPAVTWVDATVRGHGLPVIQPHFGQGIAIFLVLLGIILLGALADRFWCRYLCPLGALLGWLSKVQVLRPMVGNACTRCGACAAACRVGAIDAPTPHLDPTECTMCLDCLTACPEPGALRFDLPPRLAPAPGGAASAAGGTVSAAGRSASPARPSPRTPKYDPTRRQFLAAAGAGAGAVLLLGSGVWRTQQDPALLRPPGVTGEAAFLSHCLRCAECMKVCPTSGLQPALGEAGLEGIWTPVLRPRLGPCDYACTACGHTCPSGAIPLLELAEKRRQVIGIAVIDRDRCLPWAQGTPCIVCEEMCPTPRKAITLDAGRTVTNAQGGRDWVKRPTVHPELCIGCGICENKCPVSGRAAIVVERHARDLALPG